MLVGHGRGAVDRDGAVARVGVAVRRIVRVTADPHDVAVQVHHRLQVEAIDKTIKNMRVDYKPRVEGREGNNPHNLAEYTNYTTAPKS